MNKITLSGELMCWYVIKTPKGKFEFRSDAVTSEKDEDKLHKLHCTISNRRELLAKCLEILTPYLPKILELIDKELKRPTEDFFPGPSVIKL